MTKSELIKIHINDVDRIINATLDAIKDELSVGGEVNLIGFGKFHVKERAARVGMNPRTGEEIQVDAYKLPYFTAGRAFKEAVQS